MDVRVERAAPEAGLALRQRVLRPHQTLDELRSLTNDDPETGNYVAVAGGSVVSTASVLRAAPPWAPDERNAWRLRAMATAEEWRGKGVGGRVLDSVIEHVRTHGGGLLWCNARARAVPFYVRAGFRARGEQWEEPVIGPHIAMEREVSAAPEP